MLGLHFNVLHSYPSSHHTKAVGCYRTFLSSLESPLFCFRYWMRPSQLGVQIPLLPRRREQQPVVVHDRQAERVQPRDGIQCHRQGARFNRKKINLSFSLKNGSRILFDYVICVVVYTTHLSKFYLKPKLKPFFKPKLKPFYFY